MSLVLTMRGGKLDCAIDIADSAIAGLIAYLASGSLGTGARLVANSPELDFVELLRDKMSSPLRACAAAYVLLGSADLSQPAPWHKWIGNLSEWFDEIPDGMILKARYDLITAETDRCKQRAAKAVRAALRRGIPHYTLGLSWLRELMSFFPDDELVRACMPYVEIVAAHVDTTKPFTCLWLGRE